MTWFTTTAVAADSFVVRFDSTLAPRLDPKLLDEALAVARTLEAPGGNRDVASRELEEVMRGTKQQPPKPPQPIARTEGGEKKTGEREVGVAILVQNGVGEFGGRGVERRLARGRRREQRLLVLRHLRFELDVRGRHAVHGDGLRRRSLARRWAERRDLLRRGDSAVPTTINSATESRVRPQR